jgi:hypothetical protein
MKYFLGQIIYYLPYFGRLLKSHLVSICDRHTVCIRSVPVDKRRGGKEPFPKPAAKIVATCCCRLCCSIFSCVVLLRFVKASLSDQDPVEAKLASHSSSRLSALMDVTRHSTEVEHQPTRLRMTLSHLRLDIDQQTQAFRLAQFRIPAAHDNIQHPRP